MAKLISLSGRDWKLCGMMPTEWLWKQVWQKPFDSVPGPWFSAEVPGSVQLDLMEAGEIPDWTVDLNSRACEWTSYRDWVHVREFTAPPPAPDERALLRLGGVDWMGHVYLNGTKLGDAEGMWIPRQWDVSGLLCADGPNLLVIVVDHAPEQEGQIGWTERVRHWKPRFAYDWDWCTRLIPLGIFGDVDLLYYQGARLDDVWIRPQVSADLSRAEIPIALALDCIAAGEIEAVVSLDLDGKPVARASTILNARLGSVRGDLTLEVKKPVLWEPNEGLRDRQPLYTCRTEILAGGKLLDSREEAIGLRRVEHERVEGAPDDALPYQLVVNGRKVFMRGSNWAPVTQLYGRHHAARYGRWIELARRANINMLRVWGGGLLEREEFYQACDHAGIMVWQEFFQSSSGITNWPDASTEYQDYAREQAPHAVRARRNHPSLVIWCGGNELIGAEFRPLDSNYPVLKILKDIVAAEDPDRLYLPTSPTGPICGPDPDFKGRMGDIHGHWTFQGDGAHQDFYTRCDYQLHSEFGTEGAANIESLRTFASDNRLWPPDATNPLWLHHGSWWINRSRVEELFGPTDALEPFVMASQWLHAESLRFLFEEDRRKAPRCAGAMNWQFNESFPNTSCTNLLDFYGEPKPVYYAVRQAFCPFMLSARAPRFCWHGHAAFEAEVWGTLAFLAEAGDIAGEWALLDMRGQALAEGAFDGKLDGPRSLKLGDLTWPIPPGSDDLFVLRLQGKASPPHTDCKSAYLFSAAPAPGMARVWSLPRTSLRIAASSAGTDSPWRRFEVTNDGDVWALGVRLRTDRPGEAVWSDSFLMLPPGDRATLCALADPRSTLNVIAEGFNVPPTTLAVDSQTDSSHMDEALRQFEAFRVEPRGY
jgi:beta-mannosidase